MRFLLASLVTVLAAACSGAPKVPPPLDPHALAADIRAGHHAASFPPGPALRYGIAYSFADFDYAGVATYELTTGRFRLDLDDGGQVVFDGRSTWVAPADHPFRNAAFHAIGVPFLWTLPFRIGQRGVFLSSGPDRTWQGRTYHTAQLRFDRQSGLIKTYLIWIEPESSLLSAVAFSLTYFADGEEVPLNAVSFDEFVEVDGVLLPTVWRGHLWSDEGGIGDGHIAVLSVEQPRFVEPERDAFAPPPGARQEGLRSSPAAP